MRKNAKLSLTERHEIEELLRRHWSMRAIARMLGRSPNTVSRELRRVPSGYRADRAHVYARTKLRFRRLQWRKIEAEPALKAYVIGKLKETWNPEGIAERMRRDGLPWYVSKSSIYRWLRSVYGERYCILLWSRRKRVRKRRCRLRRQIIPDRISIAERPKGAENRSRYGHWESDAVVSGKEGSGAVAVLQERKSRYCILQKVSSLRPRPYVQTLSSALEGVQARSLTFDNGIENQRHRSLGIPTFFCDPYASWQKGGIERLNGMLRRYFPKGTDFSLVSQTELDAVQEQLNRKPRRILGFRSAEEVARSGRVLKDVSS
jgi:IS30 family transposase